MVVLTESLGSHTIGALLLKAAGRLTERSPIKAENVMFAKLCYSSPVPVPVLILVLISVCNSERRLNKGQSLLGLLSD